MGLRLAGLKVEKKFRAQSKWACESLCDNFSGVARARLSVSAADIVAVGENIHFTDETKAQQDTLERLDMWSTGIGRLGLEQQNLRSPYVALEANLATLRNI
jgi:hypothetical protein